jgi:hypothetical protein
MTSGRRTEGVHLKLNVLSPLALRVKKDIPRLKHRVELNAFYFGPAFVICNALNLNYILAVFSLCYISITSSKESFLNLGFLLTFLPIEWAAQHFETYS